MVGHWRVFVGESDSNHRQCEFETAIRSVILITDVPITINGLREAIYLQAENRPSKAGYRGRNAAEQPRRGPLISL